MMFRNTRILLGFCIFFSLIISSWAQGDIAIGLSFLNEHVSDPTIVQAGRPLHPGLSLSAEFERKARRAFRYSHTIELGYYYHRDFNQAIFLRWKPKFSLIIGKLVGFHGVLGIGYAHSLPTREVYVLNRGIYRSKRPIGLPHLMPSGGLGLSILGDRLWGTPTELFVHYELFSLAPYSLKGEVPFTINTLLSIGLRHRVSEPSNFPKR